MRHVSQNRDVTMTGRKEHMCSVVSDR
jgi:hypothetical protein